MWQCFLTSKCKHSKYSLVFDVHQSPCSPTASGVLRVPAVLLTLPLQATGERPVHLQSLDLSGQPLLICLVARPFGYWSYHFFLVRSSVGTRCLFFSHKDFLNLNYEAHARDGRTLHFPSDTVVGCGCLVTSNKQCDDLTWTLILVLWIKAMLREQRENTPNSTSTRKPVRKTVHTFLLYMLCLPVDLLLICKNNALH